MGNPLALLPEGVTHPDFLQSLAIVFASASPVDGVTGATPLDSFKHYQGLTVDQIYQQNALLVKQHLLPSVGSGSI